MFNRFLTLSLVLATVLGLAGNNWQATRAAAPAFDLAAPLADHFGYAMNDAASEAWLDATDGTKVTFSNVDDDFAGPFAIGFPFKYYENTYTQLYIATDGFVSFGSGMAMFRNAPIPWDTRPNNLVAPFWDDLYIPNASSGIFYKLFGSTPGQRRFVIEWYQIDDPAYTFEVVLYEDGNILFQYNQLDGDVTSATTGIEDAEGIDGLQYVYNSPGLAVGKDILFTRPPAGPHVKLLPPYHSGFASNHQAYFQVVVRNTGDNQADSFDLRTSSDNPAWSVSLLDGSGKAFEDTNGNGVIDTGQISVGAAVSVTVQLAAQPAAPVGDFITVEITATSKLQSDVNAVGTIRSAIPAPFAQVYVTGDGVHVQQIWEQNIIDRHLDNYTGASLAIRSITSDDYIVAWEKYTTYGSVAKTEIEYKIVNRLKGEGALQTLTDSQSFLQPPVVNSDARMVAIGTAENGQNGLVWRQLLTTNDSSPRFQSNIYFAVMNTAGTLLSQRFSVTNDGNFYTYGGDYRDYSGQSITVQGNRFFTCWLDRFVQSGNSGKDLYCAAYSFNGQQIQQEVPRFKVDGSTTATLDEPAPVGLSNGDVLLAYTKTSGGGLADIVYAVHSNTGQQVKSPSLITGANGDRVRALQFPNGNILVAWVNASSMVGYALLDNSYNLIAGYPQFLPGAANRTASYISLTLERLGNAVVSWIDPEESTYLFYALLDKNGGVVTPPMLFYSPVLLTSSYGFGNAAYTGIFKTYLPIIRNIAH